MVLTADTSSAPFGACVDSDGSQCYRGIQWSNGDRALLGCVLRVRVPRAHRVYMQDWWPDGNPPWAEFLGVLTQVCECHTLNWLTPWDVLNARGLVAAFNAAHPSLLVLERTVALSSDYSDDVPSAWLVGTASVTAVSGIDIQFGELDAYVLWLH
jgi:hypothetical protein